MTYQGLLFTPLEVAGMRLKNRIVMPPMGTGLPDHEGFVTDRTIDYYRRRAEGGVGMISVEASLIAPDSFGVGPEIRLHGDQFVPGLQRLVESVKAHDCAVGIQLWHPGRQTLLGQPIAPSPIPLSPRTPVPHELTVDEIRGLVRRYGEAAAWCQQAGFDFVEIHGAHCYLPCEFMSPLSNRRTDEYGGELRNRARFSLEIVEAIAEACGPRYPIFFRISGTEGAHGGFDVEDAAQIAAWLVAAGVACISVSAGNWYALHYTIPPMFMERGCLVPYAARIRERVQAPVIAAGRLDDAALCERILSQREADLVAIGRQLIADADWPNKIRDGVPQEVRPCISCNACVDLVAVAKEARCAVNPEVGREGTWKIEPAASPRRVMVVGGGPAGLEAARIARVRGHDVSIWDREPELGGKLDVASRAPDKGVVLRFRDYQVRKLTELGVSMHTGQEVSPELVNGENPDVVLLANGADPLLPPIPGIEGPTVIEAQELLLDRIEVRPGERVAVIGGSATGCETAEHLVVRGAGKVTILDMLPQIGQGIEQITRRHLMSWLRQHGVDILTRAKVTMIEPNQILYQRADGETTALEIDRVALALGWRSRGTLMAGQLEGREVVALGDASRPADFVAAINAGADAGLTV